MTHTLHHMDLPVSLLEGGHMSPFWASRVLWAETPGLAPGWSPGKANLGNVNLPVCLFSMVSL